MTNEYLWRKLEQQYHTKTTWLDWIKGLLAGLIYLGAVYYLSIWRW